MRTIEGIAKNFFPRWSICSVDPLGEGLINDTYLVKSDSGLPSEWILQKLNKKVFQQPDRLMANLSKLLEHATNESRKDGCQIRIRLPKIHLTQNLETYFVDCDGEYWRALEYIANSQTLQTIRHESDAEQIGFALGQFHRLVATMNTDCLHDILPGFHDCPAYLDDFHASLQRSNKLINFTDLRYAIEFLDKRKTSVAVLENAKRSGHLKIRAIHGDPKINNILFDSDDQRAVSLIDLDTVKPGLFQYDIGDCLRSACNRQSEDRESTAVDFDLDICRLILKAYLAETATILNDYDYRYLYDAIHLLPLELGIRFLTDHLDGDEYFKVEYAGQNLLRALVQFRLTERIEQQDSQIYRMIDELVDR